MDDVYKYILNDVGLTEEDVVVVAVSYGPDSMALLHLLLKVREHIKIKIVVVMLI